MLDLKYPFSDFISNLRCNVKCIKGLTGTPPDAEQILKLLMITDNLKAACHSLCQSLRLTHDDTKHLEKLLKKLVDTVRDLHREGGIAVRDLEDVWADLVKILEDFLASVIRLMAVWSEKQLHELHKCFLSVKQAMDIFTHKQIWKSERDMQSSFSLVIAVIREAVVQLQYWSVCLSQSMVDSLQSWLLQLQSTVHLLAIASTRFAEACDESNQDISVYRSAVNIVGQRICSIVDEIIKTTALENGSDDSSMEDVASTEMSTVGDCSQFVSLAERLASRRKKLSDSTVVFNRTQYTTFS